MITFDQDLNMYYDEVNNRYIVPEEYRNYGKTKCEHCDELLLPDEVCWGDKH
jgi:hypothetical protein